MHKITVNETITPFLIVANKIYTTTSNLLKLNYFTIRLRTKSVHFKKEIQILNLAELE